MAARRRRCAPSDRVAVYAKVDKVILEPSAGEPATIQVSGCVLGRAGRQSRTTTSRRPAAICYYRLPSRVDLGPTREWADLQSVAGTGEIVAFGSRWGRRAARATDSPTSRRTPIRTLNAGLTTGSDAAAISTRQIRALLDFKPASGVIGA